MNPVRMGARCGLGSRGLRNRFVECYDHPLLIVYAERLYAEDKEEKLEALNPGGF